MKRCSEVAVTLAPALYHRLADEARELGVSLEWLVASLVADTIESEEPEAVLA